MDSAPVIKLGRVTKRFGSFEALKRISFEVKTGEVVGFVGANGAGKTTAISTILGFIGASEGSVELFGKKVLPSNAHTFHSRIGYASGDMALPGRLTGQQYLSFVRRQNPGDHSERFEALCALFQPQLNKKINTLSRGNKQKIALIAAFMTDAEVLIFDEPTSGLDPVMQEVFLEYVRGVQAAGKTVFMSSHYLTEVADVCSRIILMRSGEIVQDASAAKLLESGGKTVKIVTGYARTLPPKQAQHVERHTAQGVLTLEFTYKGDVAQLQHWVAGIKQLQDIEVTDHKLDAVFASLYEGEGEKS